MDLLSIFIIVAIIGVWLVVFSAWKNSRSPNDTNAGIEEPRSKFRGFRNALSKIQLQAFTGNNYKPTPILTNNEINFLAKLQIAIPEVGGFIFPQVAFTAFMQPTHNPKSRLFMKFLAVIARKRCDFLIVDKMFNPLFIVECDDSSHRGRESIDDERDRTVATVGVQTIRLYNNDMLSPDEIRSAIFSNAIVADKINLNFGGAAWRI